MYNTFFWVSYLKTQLIIDNFFSGLSKNVNNIIHRWVNGTS